MLAGVKIFEYGRQLAKRAEVERAALAAQPGPGVSIEDLKSSFKKRKIYLREAVMWKRY